MIQSIKPGDRFKHFKTGGYYKIISLFMWEQTKQQSIEYENEITGERWGRPMSVFLEEVSVDNKLIPRFEKIENSQQNLDLFKLEEKYDENNQPYWIVHHWTGESIATLQKGNAAIIVLSYINMMNQSQQRGNDYLAGAMAGLTHMQLLGYKEIIES